MGYEQRQRQRPIGKAPVPRQLGFARQRSSNFQRRGGAQRKDADERDSTELVGEVVRSPGQALDPDQRAALRSSVGQDFGKVRVHTDASAAASAEALGAAAYTVGAHIVFARERYAPRTTAGERLLAHELMHTIQQGVADASHLSDFPTVAVDDRSEREARRAGAGEFPAATTASPVAIARALPGGPEETGVAAPPGRGGATALDIEFHAFIPGTLGDRSRRSLTRGT